MLFAPFLLLPPKFIIIHALSWSWLGCVVLQGRLVQVNDHSCSLPLYNEFVDLIISSHWIEQTQDALFLLSSDPSCGFNPNGTTSSYPSSKPSKSKAIWSNLTHRFLGQAKTFAARIRSQSSQVTALARELLIKSEDLFGEEPTLVPDSSCAEWKYTRLPVSFGCEQDGVEAVIHQLTSWCPEEYIHRKPERLHKRHMRRAKSQEQLGTRRHRRVRSHDHIVLVEQPDRQVSIGNSINTARGRHPAVIPETSINREVEEGEDIESGHPSPSSEMEPFLIMGALHPMPDVPKESLLSRLERLSENPAMLCAARIAFVAFSVGFFGLLLWDIVIHYS